MNNPDARTLNVATQNYLRQQAIRLRKEGKRIGETTIIPSTIICYLFLCGSLSCCFSCAKITARHPRANMQISPEQGQFMALLVQLIGAAKTLELGVFTGYSSLRTALALPDNGRIVACDVSGEFTAVARRYWEAAGVAHKIDLRLAPAIVTLDRLLAEGQENTFDFAFIDADKENYLHYYDRVLQLVRPGGLIAIDNVLWGGRVAQPEIQDEGTLVLRELNRKLHQDRRINLSLVPIADGLTLAIKQP